MKGGLKALNDRKGIIQWIKEHKQELIIAGVSITTILLIVVGIKKREEIAEWLKSLKGIVKQPMQKSSPKEVFVESVIETPKLEGVVSEVSAFAEPIQVDEAISPVLSGPESYPFEVSSHIRNLPQGQHASPEKVAEALENGITLLDGQTLVDSYMKREIAA